MADPRQITEGREIPRENYCDQPYVVRLDDGTWVCVMTTGRGVEGQPGQHIISLRSTDRGASWSEPVDIEPADGPEASWAMPVLLPSGRIGVFYVYNTANRREVITDAGTTRRVDTLGDLMMKVSDDGGRSWSAERWPVPVRAFDIDRRNPYGGEVRFFWGVGKPIVAEGSVLMGLAKVGRFGHGFMSESEGFFVRSDNLATEPDPARVEWLTLPDGEVGLRAPDGTVADEHNLVHLGGRRLFCTYRTTQGHPCHAYSEDFGHTWTPPEYMSYGPGARRVRHPRAANFVRRLAHGRFVYWFHNHGGTWYDDRNPAWLLGGELRDDGRIHWSQPEIVCYDDDPSVRMSYPDFIEEPDGTIWFTETQKSIARAHQLAPELLTGLWGGETGICRDGLLLELPREPTAATVPMPALPDLRGRGGFTLEFELRLDDAGAGQLILDSRADDGAGLRLLTTDREAVAVVLSDGRSTAYWDCDAGLLRPGEWQHLAVTVDAGPRIITWLVDGLLCDGATQRQFGWGRFSPHLRVVSGGPVLRLAPSLRGRLGALRVYGRPLRSAEVVANRAG